jgi:hypothetical protein
MKVIGMKDKKTIRDWEQEFELNIVDMDGFNKRDPHLFERLFTKEEFEKAIAFCTVIHKRQRRTLQPNSEQIQYSHVKKHQKQYKRAKINIHLRRAWMLYAAFPMPAAASLLFNHLYRFISCKIRIPWYYPLCVGILGLFVILLEPATTLFAGPLYVWYLVFSFIADILGTLYYQLSSNMLHKGALPPAHEPFLNSVNLLGNPMSLYFSPGKAITSSIVIAILIVCAIDIQRRLASTKSAR